VSKAARKKTKQDRLDDCLRITRAMLVAEVGVNPNKRVRLSLPPGSVKETGEEDGKVTLDFDDEATHCVFDSCYTLEEIEESLCELVERVLRLNTAMIIWNYAVEGLHEGTIGEHWNLLADRVDQLATTLFPLEIRKKED